MSSRPSFGAEPLPSLETAPRSLNAKSSNARRSAAPLDEEDLLAPLRGLTTRRTIKQPSPPRSTIINSNGVGGPPPKRRRVPVSQRQVTPSSDSESEEEAVAAPSQNDHASTSRHASSSLSDQSSKSPSPPRIIRAKPDKPSSPKKSTAKRRATVTPTASSDDSEANETDGSFRQRGRGRPRGLTKPTAAVLVAKGTPRRTAASAPPSNSPVTDLAFAVGGRATRATVALPPGYIEGVKSTRMPRASVSTRAESMDVEEDVKPKKVPKAKGKEVELPKPVEPAPVGAKLELIIAIEPVLQPQPEPEPEPMSEPVLEHEPIAESEVVWEVDPEPASVVKPLMDIEMEEVAPEIDVEIEVEAIEVEALVEEEPEEEVEEEEEEEELDAETLLNLEIERIAAGKRRKLEDAAAAVLAAEHEKIHKRLDHEAGLINDSTHPLIKLVQDKLAAEKALRLSQLVELREHTILQIARNLEVETEAVWRQWADSKDTLRMDLYLENHDHLKQLISEEREYPFVRDHPLLVNSHGLPPTPFFRAPLPPQMIGEYRRHNIKSTTQLEAPPLNRALDHSTWKLTSSEIEADLAIFADFNAPFVPRPFSMTIEQPYGIVHYPPVLPTPPAVFQPPSAALASSAYFSAQQASAAPRLPHDNLPPSNRPNGNFSQALNSRWQANPASQYDVPPRKSVTATHSHVQQGSLVLPTKAQHASRISPGLNGNGPPAPSYIHHEHSHRPRIDIAPKPPIVDPSNWFAHPRPSENIDRRPNPPARPLEAPRPVLPHVSNALNLPHNVIKRPLPPPPSQSNVQQPVLQRPPPTEAWKDWRPTPREPSTSLGKPLSDGLNPRPFQMYDRPTPTTISRSAFAAFQPGEIPLFNGGKGSKLGGDPGRTHRTG